MTKTMVGTGWASRTLRSLALDKQFSIVDGPFGTQLHAAEYTTQGVPLVRVGNTSYSGKFFDEDLVYITEAKADRLARSEVVPNDIIVAKTGATIGKLALFPSKYPRGIIASSCIKISLDTNKADPLYLRYRLASHEGQRKIMDGASGSTRLTINCVPFGDISFIVPDDIATQKRIARILSTADEVIEKSEAAIEKYKALRQAAMHNLFTRGLDNQGRLRPAQKEAPEFYKKSPLGWVPKDWDVVKIDNIAEHVGSGVTPTGGSAVYKEEGVLFLRSQNVHFSGLHLNDVAFIPITTHNSMERSKVHPYDVLLNITGASIGRCCYFPPGIGEANVNQHVCLIRPKSNTEAKALYLATFLASYLGQRQIELLNAGSNREGLNYQQVRAFDIPIPQEESEIDSIANRIGSIHSLLSKEILAHKKYMAIKQSLMSDLLSGKVPVKA